MTQAAQARRITTADALKRALLDAGWPSRARTAETALFAYACRPYWADFATATRRNAVVIGEAPKVGFRMSRPSDLSSEIIESIIRRAIMDRDTPPLITERIKQQFRRLVIMGGDKKRARAAAKWNWLTRAAIEAAGLRDEFWSWPVGVLAVLGYQGGPPLRLYTRQPDDGACIVPLTQALTIRLPWFRPGSARVQVMRIVVPGPSFCFFRFQVLSREPHKGDEIHE